MASFFSRLSLAQIIFGLCAGFVVITTVQVTSNFMGYHETGVIQDVWNEYDQGPRHKSKLLHELRTAIGFGGMIHQFKNYVIRRDEGRLQKIQNKVDTAKNALSEYHTISITQEEKSALDTIAQNISAYESAALKAKSMVDQGLSISEIDKVIKIDDGPALKAMLTLDRYLVEGRNTSTAELSNAVKALHQQFAMGTVIGLVVAALCSFFAFMVLRGLYNQLGTDPKRLVSVADSVARGDLHFDLEEGESRPQGVFKAMLQMKENLRDRIDKEQRIASENGRIKQALESSSGATMIADADHRIVYMNQAMTEMMAELESEFRKEIPHFNASTLLNSDISVFNKNPSTQDSMLNRLQATHIAEMLIADVNIQIVINPVWGQNKERLGTVVEWINRTQEVATQKEIQHIVNSAKTGDLSQRIDLNGKDGFFSSLSAGVNEMVDVSERVIKETATVISAMSSGDLTRGIESDYQGSFGQLKDDVNSTIAKLTEVMGEITNSAGLVYTESQALASGNTDLASRTEEQSTSLEATASRMEEMTSTVHKNAENAREANQVASGAREQAEQGGTVVNRAVAAMSEITESSNKIAAIIGVIDEIAFQTNLLALNAAVEAARAGEQGRGFAVVASEVRNLAGRSATAANEIKGLINDSVSKVEEGSKLVDASGRTLEEIVDSVKKVSEIIANIAEASQDQSEGIDQVNHAIAQMEEVTEQNTSLVKEAASSSESMGEQASRLNEMVGFFKTGATPVRRATNTQAASNLKRPASTPKRPAVKAKTTYEGVERRQAKRPWSESSAPKKPEMTKAPAAPASTPTAKASSVSDDDWSEF